MNDFEYDAMQKKRVAAGARGRVCGSKSKKCGLPSDHLTAAQLKAKNGPVATYNLNEPMSWAAFKAMSADLQEEYVRGLHSRFCVGLNTISKELFGLGGPSLRNYMQRHGNELDIRGKRRLSNTEREVWERWLNSIVEEIEDEPEAVCVVEEQEAIENPPPTDSKTTAAFGMRSLCVEWCGEFNALAFMEQLSRLVLPDGKVKIRLEVEKA